MQFTPLAKNDRRCHREAFKATSSSSEATCIRTRWNCSLWGTNYGVLFCGSDFRVASSAACRARWRVAIRIQEACGGVCFSLGYFTTYKDTSGSRVCFLLLQHATHVSMCSACVFSTWPSLTLLASAERCSWPRSQILQWIGSSITHGFSQKDRSAFPPCTFKCTTRHCILASSAGR